MSHSQVIYDFLVYDLADKKQTNQLFRIFFKNSHKIKSLIAMKHTKYSADTKRRRVATSDSL